jgi:secreted PhoX family phosphatase
MDGVSRRQFVRGGLTVGVASLAFTSLAGRKGFAQDAGYGPVSPKRDLNTGLRLLALPDGFEYMSYGWTGQTMADGRPTPTDHDGMGVCGVRGNRIALVRNHELGAGEGAQCYVPGGMYNPDEFGGTTNLVFDLKSGGFVESYTSLGGTIRNCAGGPTPWGSWISCEETFHAWNSRADGFNHGYVFEVPSFDIGDGRPIRAAGRFSHEAVAIDPATSVLYETEDTNPAGFYRYVPPGGPTPAPQGRGSGGRGQGTQLQDGGTLYAMVIAGEPRKDLRGGFADGTTFRVEWQEVTDPEAQFGRAFDSAPDAAIFSRGEGCWEDAGLIYFVSTDGGAAELGQVWVYDPRAETVTLLYESRDASDVDGPDNIAISPRGGIILCEDGGSDPKRLIGLTPAGETFPFAENRIVLEPGDIDTIDDVFPGTKDNFWDNPEGDFTGREWAGATFHGDWLFANVQSPGVTFAIRGPWNRGAL